MEAEDTFVPPGCYGISHRLHICCDRLFRSVGPPYHTVVRMRVPPHAHMLGRMDGFVPVVKDVGKLVGLLDCLESECRLCLESHLRDNPKSTETTFRCCKELRVFRGWAVYYLTTRRYQSHTENLQRYKEGQFLVIQPKAGMSGAYLQRLTCNRNEHLCHEKPSPWHQQSIDQKWTPSYWAPVCFLWAQHEVCGETCRLPLSRYLHLDWQRAIGSCHQCSQGSLRYKPDQKENDHFRIPWYVCSSCLLVQPPWSTISTMLPTTSPSLP